MSAPGACRRYHSLISSGAFPFDAYSDAWSQNSSSPSMADDTHTITALLHGWHAGRQDDAHRLMDLVYSELHKLAARQMRKERGEHTLQTTALVHEVYVRLCASEPIDWQNRSHFF